MRIKLPFVCFLLLLINLKTSFASSTGDSTAYLLPGDTLELSISSFNEKLITHTFEPGQTLFSLAQFYGLTVEELKYYNAGLLDGVAIGDDVNIPIPNRAIVRYATEFFNYNAYIPIFYTIQKGDTFYGLSMRLFKMHPDEIRRRLIPMDSALKIGQQLFVGWIAIDGVPEDQRSVRGHPLFRKNQELRGPFIGQKPNRSPRKIQGAAVWDKDGKEQNEFVVLFDKAPVNSFIAIDYPMRGRTVYAKVVGKIPPTIYSSNVKIVMSSLTAKLLGAKDEEFFVRVQYY